MTARTIPLVLATVGGLAAAAVGVAMVGASRLAEGGDTVAGLVARLEAGGGPARREAASTLGQVVGPGATVAARALIVATRDPDPDVRARAARSLATLPPANPDRPIHADAVEALATLAKDPEPAVRLAATAGLLALGARSRGVCEVPPAREADDLRRLLARLDDPDPEVRRTARAALDRPGLALKPETDLPVLATTLRTGTAEARAVAASILGRAAVRCRAGRDLIATAARDPDPSVRAEAVASLATFADDAPTPDGPSGGLVDLEELLGRIALRLSAFDPGRPLLDDGLDGLPPARVAGRGGAQRRR